MSFLAGWVADRRLPRFLRAPVYTGYARCTGAGLEEVRDPLADHASLTEFFVRRLKDGARPIDPEPSAIVSPCDGTLQAAGRVERGALLQAKGRPYLLEEFLGSGEEARACDGGYAWTIYLSPRDYHRVHAPESCTLLEVRRIPGARFSVAPRVLERRKVLAINDRAVFRLETARGPAWMVMVGALNVGRIRIVGDPDRPAGRFERGEEMARFEMGSTVVLVVPPGASTPAVGLAPGARLLLGQRIGSWSAAAAAGRA